MQGLDQGTSGAGYNIERPSKERMSINLSRVCSMSQKFDDLKVLYSNVLSTLQEKYEVEVDQLHDHVAEIRDNEFPVFKLLVGVDEKEGPLIVVSFQVEVDAPSAIEWYKRLWQLIPDLAITESYIVNDSGSTLLGQEAHAYVMEKMERDILTHLEEQGEVENVEPEAPEKVYTSAEEAIKDFMEAAPKRGKPWN